MKSILYTVGVFIAFSSRSISFVLPQGKGFNYWFGVHLTIPIDPCNSCSFDGFNWMCTDLPCDIPPEVPKVAVVIGQPQVNEKHVPEPELPSHIDQNVHLKHLKQQVNENQEPHLCAEGAHPHINLCNICVCHQGSWHCTHFKCDTRSELSKVAGAIHLHPDLEPEVDTDLVEELGQELDGILARQPRT